MMDVKLEASTVVVTGLDVVKNHRGDSLSPSTATCSTGSSGGDGTDGVDEAAAAAAAGRDWAASRREDRASSRRGSPWDFFRRRHTNKAATKKSRMKDIVLDIIRCMDHPLNVDVSRRRLPPSKEQGQIVAKSELVNTQEGLPQSVIQAIADDFRPGKGDRKILRAVGRTAAVNAVVLVTAAAGGATALAGFAAGGAITSKRIFDGLVTQDEREVAKALAVYGAATAGSVLGQAAASAVMLGLVGAGLPAAAAVAFVVGCVCGISAGALSEWTVDGLIDTFGQVSEWTMENVLESLARMRIGKVMRGEIATAPKAVSA